MLTQQYIKHFKTEVMNIAFSETILPVTGLGQEFFPIE